MVIFNSIGQQDCGVKTFFVDCKGLFVVSWRLGDNSDLLYLGVRRYRPGGVPIAIIKDTQ